MKKQIIPFLILFTALSISAQRLPLFGISQFFDEQVYSFTFNKDVFVHINAPSIAEFDSQKKVLISLFALPNGNTTDQTIGQVLRPGDDWHFDIQHIGAQTRFLRKNFPGYNYVTVYLENSQKSWPAWSTSHSDKAELTAKLVDSVKAIFKNFDIEFVLTGHSGGGRFTFNFLDFFTEIPSFIKRIMFLDSNYGYDNSYGDKLITWINKSTENYLCTIAYNDSVALYNAQPVVSATGGTWYRSRMMKNYFSSYYEFTNEEDDEFLKHTALDGRIKIILKKNPDRLILHTVQVERNGYIEGMLSGTQYEETNYTYYGERAYTGFVQKYIPALKRLDIPERNASSVGGTEFMNSIKSLSFADREAKILDEFLAGNIPDFMRSLIQLKTEYKDAAGASHKLFYQVMPDYLAIGSNSDYCRVPMGPIIAQKIANRFGMTMPTSKLVDNIYINCSQKLNPVTYPWSEGLSETVGRFMEHSAAIDAQLKNNNAVSGELTGGTKKDVILSNKITDPARPNHVVIYGWHQLNGQPIQPVTNIHIDIYVDYSHGIRLLNSEVLLDSTIVDIKTLLRDPVLFRVLSDESLPMEQPSYLKDDTLPEKPKGFGLINRGNNSVELIVPTQSNAESYTVMASTNGLDYTNHASLLPENLIIEGLQNDSLYFIKIKTENSAGTSPESETLCVYVNESSNNTIIVNGFDRMVDGNTYDFVKQHATALLARNKYADAVSNELVRDGLVDLKDYSTVDYILGEESTADETFDNIEQMKIKEYLNKGGNLFISGSEIAWDLDNKGSATDRDFFRYYFKARYISDAPNNAATSYYRCFITEGNPFSGLNAFNFDNGLYGSYNVDWPDVFRAENGSRNFMGYWGLDTTKGWAGIYYSGLFPEGVNPGKLVYLGIPFETIYPANTRNSFMAKIIDFFEATTDVDDEISAIPAIYRLFQNYPNPFNPISNIKFEIANSAYVDMRVYDILGREVEVLVNEIKSPGQYQVLFNAGNELSSGIYFCKFTALETAGNKKFADVIKMTLLK